MAAGWSRSGSCSSQLGSSVLGWALVALGVVVVAIKEHRLLFGFHISPGKLDLSARPKELSSPKRIFTHSAL